MTHGNKGRTGQVVCLIFHFVSFLGGENLAHANCQASTATFYSADEMQVDNEEVCHPTQHSMTLYQLVTSSYSRSTKSAHLTLTMLPESSSSSSPFSPMRGELVGKELAAMGQGIKADLV